MSERFARYAAWLFGIAVPIFVNTIRKLGKVQGDLVLTFAVR